MLLVDASGSSDFGTAGQFKRELARELAAVLSFAATANSDRVGLTIFTDKTELLVQPKKEDGTYSEWCATCSSSSPRPRAPI